MVDMDFLGLDGLLVSQKYAPQTRQKSEQKSYEKYGQNCFENEGKLTLFGHVFVHILASYWGVGFQNRSPVSTAGLESFSAGQQIFPK